MEEKLAKTGDANNFDTGDKGGLLEVGFGDVNFGKAGGFGGLDDVDDAADGLGETVEGKLADEEFALEVGLEKLPGEDEDDKGDGEVEMGTVFGELGGGEVDSNFFVGEGETGIGNGGADALAGLGYGFISHTHDIEGGEALVDVTLDVDEPAVVAVGDS